MQSADYSKVDEALAEAAKLVPEEYVDFSAVTAAVNAVARDLDSTRQAEVDAMAKAITDAIAALQKKQPPVQSADYSKVDEALAEAAKLVPEEYVDFAAVTAAINAVVRDLDSTKQTEVDAMAKAITDAIAAVQKKQPETQPPTEGETEMPTTPENSTEASTDSTETPTDSTASGDGVQTGDNSMTSVYLVVMILALAALTFMCVSSKRKQRM